jgi:DNA-binding SARP family transcriptional activator/TolB-like protein
MNVNPRRLVNPVAPFSSKGSAAAPMMHDRSAVLEQTRPDMLSADKPMVRLRLIGQMEAWTLTAESILPTGRKTRALLAILALSAPRPVLRGRLAEMLWSRRPEEQARASLRQEIHRLLDALGPVGGQIVAIHRDHLTLRPGAVWVDVEEVMRASPGKPAALCLLDGDLLEDLDGIDPTFDNWLAAERERLRDRARLLAEQMLRDQNDPEFTIPAAQQLLAIDRSHEGAWRALMRAYASRGERGMALQAYERCRAVLADQLDAHPSDETQRLAAEIRASAPGGGRGGSHAIRAEQRPEPRQDFRLPPRPSPTMAAEIAADRAQESIPSPRLDPRVVAAAVPPRPLPRVGVLPMQPGGGGEADDGFAGMLAEEITTALARNRTLNLVSSASLARAAQASRDEAALGRAFALDYLLDGTMHRSGERLRVSLRLLDLRSNAQIVWADRFDRQSADPFGVQDEIALAVAARMEPALLAIEAERAAQRPSGDPSAGELALRAFASLARIERGQFAAARGLLAQATAQDQGHTPAHAWMALTLLAGLSQGWSANPEADSAEAVRCAERAVMLDPQDARALTIAGHVRAALQQRCQEAMVLHDRALTINPSLALAWTFSGLAHAYAGQLDEAWRRVEYAAGLAPLDPLGYFNAGARTLIALLRHEHAAAVDIGRELGQVQPLWAEGAQAMLAAQGHAAPDHAADDPDIAQTRARVMAISPDLSLAALETRHAFGRDADRQHLLNGLRRAGLPE